MPVNRLDRVNALLLREIADDLYRVLQSDAEIDIAGVTVTKVECAPNLRTADVWVSVRDARNLTLRFTPHLRFRLDVGIAKGDRVLDILSHLPPPADGADDQEPAP